MYFVGKIKVLVVDDSAFMRKMISDFLSSDDRIEVVDTARNGEDAIKKVRKYELDVITLDVEMPIMNGLDALKIIMNEFRLPVIMLSSTTKEGAENTILAMEYGAFDFIAKPSGAISLDIHKVKNEIIEKVILASKTKVHLFQQTTARTIHESEATRKIVKYHPEQQTYDRLNNKKRLICIGTSTGGPRALQQVLTSIPKSINAPIMIVQHMPPGFTKSLASRLDSICDMHVKEAIDGDILEKGTAYIAPGGYHLKIRQLGKSLVTNIDQSPIRNGHRPSVDVLFESVSELAGYAKVMVIMTGMGSDGSSVLKKMKSAGDVKIIAESENTCIVYGMPKAAIATNAVDEVVNLENIAATIIKYVES